MEKINRNPYIDITDLRLLKNASEIKIGGTFYLKENEQFLRCVIDEQELKNPIRAYDLKKMTEKFIAEQRLFVRINRPFQSFV